MPPKKCSQAPSKKTENKQKEKVVQDRTFGLKNKNKSKQVQQFIKGVAHKVNNDGKSIQKIEDEQFKLMKQKKKEEEEQALLASLFKQVTIVQKDDEGNVIKDKSQIICPYFKQGLCQKGKKCKFSHDLSLFKKIEEIDLYVDQRKQLFGNVPDEINQTKIVCDNFLDAVEQGKYGWNWVCPNGMDCIYRHCLPMGFELKKDNTGIQDEEDPLEDKIEQERSKIDNTGTKITLEVFLKWKEQKKTQRKQKEEQKKDEDIKKLQSRGGASATLMSGRSLFQFNPNLFVDDDEAVSEKEYVERNDNIDEEEEEELIEKEIEEQNEDEEEEEQEEEEKKENKDKEEEEEEKKQEEWDEKQIIQKIAEFATDETQEMPEQPKKIEKIEDVQEKVQEIKQQEQEDKTEELKKKKKKNKKKKKEGKNIVINEDLFLDENDEKKEG